MAGFVSKQPNGLYCRFSTVTDCPNGMEYDKRRLYQYENAGSKRRC